MLSPPQPHTPHRRTDCISLPRIFPFIILKCTPPLFWFIFFYSWFFLLPIEHKNLIKRVKNWQNVHIFEKLRKWSFIALLGHIWQICQIRVRTAKSCKIWPKVTQMGVPGGGVPGPPIWVKNGPPGGGGASGLYRPLFSDTFVSYPAAS